MVAPQDAFEQYCRGLTNREIGKLYGVSGNRIQQILSRYAPYRQYRESKRQKAAQQIRVLANEGLGGKAIAQAMGCKISYIRSIAQQEKIRIPRRPTVRAGDRFGEWTVIRPLGYRDREGNYHSSPGTGHRNHYCLCVCGGCGREMSVATHNMRRGASTKCASCARKR